MNETAVVAPPPPLPAQGRTAHLVFSGDPHEFRRLVTRGALLELFTAGFYRFWLATDIRRHMWSHTAVEGDAAEYTGTAKELLLGFLVALAVLLPIYIVYFLIGIEAERTQAFASIPLILFFYAFGQFAMFRARRYRATRTIWRGVRFWMSGSGWAYSLHACLWALLVALTLGLALPWREAALERFKMNHTFYGELQGSFVATGGQLFKRGWWLWVLMLLLFVPVALAPVLAWSVIAANTESSETIAAATGLAIVIALVLIPAGLLFLYPIYKAITWRWWIGGIRFGRVRFESDLTNGRLYGLYWAVVGWMTLITASAGIAIGIIFGVIALFTGSWNVEDAIASLPVYVTYGITILGYFFVALIAGAVIRFYLNRGVWERVVNATTAFGLEAADDVQARGATASALGEGFADSLDIGGI